MLLAASPAMTSASGAETSKRRASAASSIDTTRTVSSEALTSSASFRAVRILDQHAEEITPVRYERTDGPRNV